MSLKNLVTMHSLFTRTNLSSGLELVGLLQLLLSVVALLITVSLYFKKKGT